MRRLPAACLAAALVAGCSSEAGRRPSASIFVGIDVSGSFHASGDYDSAIEFLSHYLYGHLAGKGELNPVKTLYVGSIGGRQTEETKSFYPIHDFQGKEPGQIHFDLRNWFPKSDKYTDFNIFFRQVAGIAQKRNLALSPIEIILLTDGIPDSPVEGEVPAQRGRYELIDLSSLEFLSRKVTVRLLFPAPMVATAWDTKLQRQRVRMWAVDDKVMSGWKAQLDREKPHDQQEKLWKWIVDNVDYRVRPLKARVRPARSGASLNDDASPSETEPTQTAPAPAGEKAPAPKAQAKPPAGPKSDAPAAKKKEEPGLLR